MTGEPEDFESFFRTRTPTLLRSAYLLTSDRHLAEDLVQETLARTHRAWHKLSREGNPEAYARQVMYNLQVSRWRRRRVPELLPGTLPERDGSDDHSRRVAERLTLKRALRALPDRQRAVIVLRFFEDRTEAETAQILGCRIGTVKSHAFRAIAKLRELMPDVNGLDHAEEVVR